MSAADLHLATVTPLRAAPPASRPGRTDPHRRGSHPAGTGRPARTATDAPTETRGGPDALRRGLTALVLLVDEVAAGRRGYPQLEPLLAPTLLRRVGAELRRQGHRDHRPLQVRSVHLGPSTADDVVEASVTVTRGGRVGALAVRLERHQGRWRATELTAPESGFAPVTASSRDDRRRRHDAFDEAAAEAAARARLDTASHRAPAEADGHPSATVVPLRSPRGSA